MPKSPNHSRNSQAGPQSSKTGCGDTNATSAKDQIGSIVERTTRKEHEDLALKSKLVPRLAKRAYHLEEGNTWWQDWKQYQKNTHPVFGICMHHPYHPIRLPQRIIILVGSIACGFVITNCVYLGFLGSEQAGEAVNVVYDAAGKLAKFQQQYTNVEIEQAMIFLLTVGSFIHSTFDMLIWYSMACFCFRPGGRFETNKICQNFGVYSAVLVVMLTVVAATSVVIVRLNADENAEYDASAAEKFAEDNLTGGGSDENQSTSSSFSFLIGYALELVFALFIFYFITSTLFFSGILGCGRVPVLGGRPYEIRREKDNANNNDQSEDGDYTIGLRLYDV